MGKKRNNAAKKKQAAKKKKISATYGVSVQKGGTIARNNGIIDKSNPMDVKTPNHTKQPMKQSATKTPQSDSSNLSQRGSAGSHENAEFQRQQASLEERSLISQSRNNHQRKKKQKKGWGNNFAHPSSMAPPTLNLTKTTQQLVDDAANQVAQMSDIGERLVSTDGKSSLAAAAGVNWKANVMQQKVEDQQCQINSFAALDESDSDNEWADGKEKASVPQFQFQPASFSFQSNFVPIGPSEDDIDPDL